jgi:hypothetical protein
VDPISLLLMAQSAVGAIRAGCQMLSEGKAEIGKFKKQVEGGVADAKAIYKEVVGIWGWLQSLFGAPKKPVERAVVPPKQVSDINVVDTPKSSKKRQPEPELSYEEFQARAVHDICENLKVYFEAMRHLKAHCRELDELALTTDKVADSAIDRIEIQWQMDQLSAQLKQSMIYGTPESLGLGSMYKEFLAKYDEILEEQEVARELKAKRERDNRWRLEHRKEILIAKVTYVIAIAMGALQVIGMYFTL